MLKRLTYILFAPVLLALIASCGSAPDQLQIEEEAQQEFDRSVNQTVEALLDFLNATQTAVMLSASPTATATATITPSPTPTATPEGPIAILGADTDCRTGPGSGYLVLEQLDEGVILAIVSTSHDPDYMLVASPKEGRACWLDIQFANLLGDLSGLPKSEIPPTPTPSLTPTPSVIWRGEWRIWVGPGTLTQYALFIEHKGQALSGSFEAADGNTVSITGILNEDYTKASGTWSSSAGGTGTFEWQRKKNNNQFFGNLDGGSDAWCGSRAGASLPSPCLGP